MRVACTATMLDPCSLPLPGLAASMAMQSACTVANVVVVIAFVFVFACVFALQQAITNKQMATNLSCLVITRNMVW
jgi:hypothetical protein